VLTWSKLLLCLSLATASLIAWGQSTATQQLQRRDQQESLAEHPRQIRKQCAALQVQLRELNQYETVQRVQRSQFSPLVACQLLHHMKAQLHGQLQITNLEFVDTSLVQTIGQAPTAGGYLSLQLISSGPTSCSRVMQSIRETNYFSDVRLSSALEKVDSTGTNLQYSVRCEF